MRSKVSRHTVEVEVTAEEWLAFRGRIVSEGKTTRKVIASFIRNYGKRGKRGK